jgi:hypothetical protein
MTPQYDVFISYSHLDNELANSLYSKLKSAGLRCFLSEKDIGAAERWESRIREALRSSQRVLLLITPNSKNSNWVIAEACAAWAHAITHISVPLRLGLDTARRSW